MENILIVQTVYHPCIERRGFEKFKNLYRPIIKHHRIPDVPDIPERGRTTWNEVFGRIEPKKKGGITKTSLLYLPENIYICNGMAFCSHEESYNKEKGRSIALGRLMREVKIFFNMDSVRLTYLLFKNTGASFDEKLIRKAYFREEIK